VGWLQSVADKYSKYLKPKKKLTDTFYNPYPTAPEHHAIIVPMPKHVVSRYQVPGSTENHPWVSEYDKNHLGDQPRCRAIF